VMYSRGLHATGTRDLNALNALPLISAPLFRRSPFARGVEAAAARKRKPSLGEDDRGRAI
jgi:hypothetical protein